MRGLAAASYLFNPYSLASSGAMSTVSLTHLAVLYSLVYAAEGSISICSVGGWMHAWEPQRVTLDPTAGAAVASMVCTAIGTYLSVYPAVLVVPIFLQLQLAKVASPSPMMVRRSCCGA